MRPLIPAILLLLSACHHFTGAKPKPAVVYRRRSGRVAGVVPAHVAPMVQAAIDEGGE